MSPLRPMSNMVLMKPIEQPAKIGRFFVPDQAKERVDQGIVVAVGPGKRNDAGVLEPCEVKPGDRVKLRHTFDVTVEIRGQKFMMCPESEIVCVIED